MVGIETPGTGMLNRSPKATRLVCCTDSRNAPLRFGNRELRATRACPRACRIAWVSPTVPRLYSRPRAAASRSDSLPEKGFWVPATLPAYGPSTCTVVFKVLTLEVTPGTGVCTELTEPPWPLRPDNGNAAGSGPGGGPCARASVLTNNSRVIQIRKVILNYP